MAAGGAMRVVRVLLQVLCTLGLVLLSLVLSVAIHVRTELARNVARPLVNELVSGLLRGDLEIGTLEEVRTSRIVARDVVLRDPQGRAVIRAERVVLWPELSRFFDEGRIYVRAAKIEHGEVQLYVSGEEGETVSLAEAFQGMGPPNPDPYARASPIPVHIAGIRIEDIEVRGDVPGFSGIRAREMELFGEIVIDESVLLRVREGIGTMTGPYSGDIGLDRIVVDFDTHPDRGLSGYIEAHRGEDRLRARIRLNQPGGLQDPEAVSRLDLEAHTDRFALSTLSQMGILESDSLAGAVRGDARLYGTTDDLQIEGYLVHDAGPIRIRGALPASGAISAEVETYDFDVAALVPAAPEVSIGGRFGVQTAPRGAESDGMSFDIRARPLVVVGLAIPAFVARGAIESDAVVIERIEAPHLGGVIEGDGRVGFDGSMDVHARIDVRDIGGDPNVQRAAKGAHGSARGTVDVTAGPSGERLRLRANLELGRFRYPPLAASRLSLRAEASGSFDSPRVDASLNAQDVAVSGQSLGTVSARLTGGPNEYSLDWSSRGGALRRFDAHLLARSSGDAWVLSAPRLEVDVGTGALSGHVENVTFDMPRIHVAGVTLDGPRGQHIAARGTLHTGNGANDFQVAVAGINLAQVNDALALSALEVEGIASANVHLIGPRRDPNLRIFGTVADLSLDSVRNANIQYDVQFDDGVLHLDVGGDFGTRGTLGIYGGVETSFAQLLAPERFVREGDFDVHVYAGHLNLAFLLPLLGPSVQDLGITGRIGGDFHVEGPLWNLRVDPAILIFDQLAIPSISPLRVKMQLGVRDKRIRIDRIWIADRSSALIELVGDLPFDPMSPPSDLSSFLVSLRDGGFDLSAIVPTRRLDTWPIPIGNVAPSGLLSEALLRAHGGRGQPIEVDVSAAGEWVEAANDLTCAEGLRPAVHLSLAAREDRTDAEVLLSYEGEAVAALRGSLALPLASWFSGNFERIPTPDFALQVSGLSLSKLPWTCGRATGEVEANVDIRGVLSGAPEVHGQVDVDHLRVISADGSGLATQSAEHLILRIDTAHASNASSIFGCVVMRPSGQPGTPVSECARIQTPAEGEAIVRAALPVEWSEGTPRPTVALDREIELAILMGDAHLAPVLALIPAVAEADAIARGRLVIRGMLDALGSEGEIMLRDGHARIVSLGQYVTGLSGAVRLSRDRIEIPEEHAISARDDDGSVRVWGEVGLTRGRPSSVHATVEPRDLAVRQEGAVLAFLSGRAEAHATIDDGGVEGTLMIDRLEVRLPEQLAGSVQTLATDPHVSVVGSAAPVVVGRNEEAYPIHLHVDATRRPFRVYRNDFDAEVRAELDATYIDPELLLGGHATIERGTFEVFGKRFEVQRGSITFPGDAEMNPIVDLVASYQLPGSGGGSVTISAGGRLAGDLRIEFSSTETNDPGEIIALLVGGGRTARETGTESTPQAAEAETAKFLAGVSAGILTLGLRQEFGDVVPNIAVETGSVLGDTRIRAGFSADRLIPEEIRDVVLGAYVEGFVTTGGRTQGGGSGGVGGGVRIELQFPEDWVVSGTYVPPLSWGLDAIWEP